MTAMIVSTTSRRGINREAFPFRELKEEQIDLNQEAANSLLGDRFLGTHSLHGIWSDLDSPTTIPSEIMDQIVRGGRALLQKSFLFYDTGVSPSQLRMLLGEEAFNEDFDRLCGRAKLWDAKRQPQWHLAFGPGNTHRESTKPSFGSLVYAMQIFYLVHGISMTGAYWIRTDTNISLSHDYGLLRGAIIVD